MQKTVDEMGTAWKDKLHEHYGLIGHPIKHHLECHHTNWYIENHVT